MGEWEKMGKPVMTQKSWAKFCMKVALNDMTNLDNLFQIAEKIAGVQSSPTTTTPHGWRVTSGFPV